MEIAILLLMSLILHIGSFWMIFKLMKKVNQTNSVKVQEITELLDLYLEEIKEENRELKAEFKENELKPEELEGNQKSDTPKKRITQLPIKESEKDNQKLRLHYSETEDYVEASTEAKILNLYHQGYDSEAIARKLDSGKTEVELTLKFHSKRQ